ncbi:MULTISPECIES: histidine phosphatase family protein [Streptomyces]|uniref:Histidine phosphatase family protein n=1 Tax=Streptomyces solicathayae TaxID=3081768 RepID=A0ABZ0LWF9_9ACTN|nr:histidine phosphatase family protein [Streptomyces sp. HUAS YS2]WOX23129.1 histidine phosphatase family protein [Streptomyces sp. HUAS YS2]
MTVRLTLVAPAMNTALREARFDDGPLEPAGRAAAAAVAAAGALRTEGARVRVSPSVRCRETADALGLGGAAEPREALAGCAMGRWRGLRLDEVAAAEGPAVAAWLADPAAAPHGGESLRALRERVGAWVERLEPGWVVAVVEPDVLRAVVVHALGLDDAVLWRLDPRPLSVTHLTGRAGRWNLRLGEPLGRG